MGLLARAFDFSLQRRSLENPATDAVRWINDFAGGIGPSDTGMPVSQATSVRLSTVFRCVQVLAEGLAQLPLFVLQQTGARGSEKATDHPLYDLLHLRPNPRMTSYQFRQMLVANRSFHGNAYATIRRDGGARIRELWPVPSRLVEPKIDEKTKELFYLITVEGGEREPWAASEVLHVPGVGFDGIRGLSVIGAAREGIGIGLAAQKYGATLFRRGGRVPGVLKTTYPDIPAEKRKNIREGWEQAVGGDANWHVPAVLPKGWDYEDIGIKPDEAQWIESRKFNVLEICRWFGVNPHKVFDYERATFTNFEQSSLSHITETIQPMVVAWEQELNSKLFSPAEREKFFAEFSLQGLMRGDTAARGQFYALMRQWGAFTANDVLELENMPGAGPAGDVRLVPFNMTNAEDLLRPGGAPAPKPAAGGAAADPAAASAEQRETQRAAHRASVLKYRRRLRAHARPIIEDVAGKIVRREIGAMERELKQNLSDGRSRRSLASLRKAIDDFYETHGVWASEKMQPIILAYAGLIDNAVAQELGEDPKDQMPAELEQFAREYVLRFGIRESSESRLQLLALIDEAESGGDAEVKDAVQQRLDDWGQKRSGKIADEEAVRFMGAAAKTLYVMAGIKVFRWVASPGACSFCVSLNGQVAGVEKWFVKAGDGVDGGAGSGAPLRPSDNIGHPPLHSSCECDVVAD